MQTEDDYIATLIGEAGNQGLDGMHAVANVIRNRGMSLRGFAAHAKMKSAQDYLATQPQWVIDRARQAWIASLDKDITGGATHFENIEAFGMPSWASAMDQTTRIGAHTFFKEKKK